MLSKHDHLPNKDWWNKIRYAHMMEFKAAIKNNTLKNNWWDMQVLMLYLWKYVKNWVCSMILIYIESTYSICECSWTFQLFGSLWNLKSNFCSTTHGKNNLSNRVTLFFFLSKIYRILKWSQGSFLVLLISFSTNVILHIKWSNFS